MTLQLLSLLDLITINVTEHQMFHANFKMCVLLNHVVDPKIIYVNSG